MNEFLAFISQPIVINFCFGFIIGFLIGSHGS